MPELPEVETIRRGLSKRLIGHKITAIEVESPKSFQGKKEAVIGSTIEDIERRAKVIRIKLGGGQNLLFHLKMTGQLIYLYSKTRFAGGHPSHDWHAELPNKYSRITFHFDNDSVLYFNDLRKFGWCRVMTNAEIEKTFREYGPEPFSPEFSAEYLAKRAEKIPSRNIKQFLMDQTIIAGVGNIYNDETLFAARISPLTKVKNLKLTDWKRVTDCLLEILSDGIEHGGTTDSDYVDAEGNKGGMQDYLNVYHRSGEKCHGCNGEVKRITVGGRGTYYCPDCQKELK